VKEGGVFKRKLINVLLCEKRQGPLGMANRNCANGEGREAPWLGGGVGGGWEKED